MTVKLANNVVGYLATAIDADDVGLALQSGQGSRFPSLAVGDHFYATLVSPGGFREIVKVTARAGDSFSIVRAQDGTSAGAFVAGSRVEMRVNAAAILDAVDTIRARADIAVTVGVGGDFATINAALEHLTQSMPIYKKGGITATITLKTGFVMAESVYVMDGQNLGWITILSEDAEVTISRKDLGPALGDTYNGATLNTYPSAQMPMDTYCAFAAYNGSVLPRIGALFSMDQTGEANNNYYGISLQGGCLATVMWGCGIKNVVRPSAGKDGRGAAVTHGSFLMGYGSIWDGCHLGVRVSNASKVNIRQGSAKNCEFAVDANGASEVACQQCDLSGATRHAIMALGCSTIRASECDMTGCGVGGDTTIDYATIYADDGSLVDASSSDISGGQRGIQAEEGARVVWTNGVCTSMAGLVLSSRTGAHIAADYCQISGCASEGAVVAGAGATIVVTNSQITDNPLVSGLYAYGGTIYAQGATITNSKNAAGDFDIRVRDGGVVYANAAVTTNGSGAVNMDDTSFDVPNVRRVEGVIYCDVDLGSVADWQIGRTAAEIAAGITPTDYAYEPGDVRRYSDAQDAADVGALYYPAGSYAQSAVEVDSSLAVWGDGRATNLTNGFVVPTAENGTISLEVRDLDGSSGTFIYAEAGNTADTDFHIENVDVVGATSAVLLQSNGTIRGTVAHLYGENLGGRGVHIGSNDITYSEDFGPVMVFDTVVKDVYPADSASHYGIISYSPYSRIIGNHVEWIGSNIGTDTEGIYTKARHSVIMGNVLVDAGQGEGFMNIKGTVPGDASDGPNGQMVVAVGNVFKATTDYNAGAPTNPTGVKLANENIIFGDAIFENFKGSAITASGSGASRRSINVHDVMIEGGDQENGAFYFPSAGKYHTFRGITIRDIGYQGFRLFGQTTETDIEITDSVIDTTDGAGIYMRPSAADVSSLRLVNVRFRDIPIGSPCINFDVNAAARADIINVDCGKRTLVSAQPFLSCASGAGANAWNIRNLVARTQSADGTTRTVHRITVPPSKPLAITVKFVATDGTDTYLLERKAVYFNAAGTVTQVGSNSDVDSELSGGVTWAGSLVISGDAILVRVAGATATNVDWTITVDADTP